MVKWIHELVLHRYWQERCHEDGYLLGDARILGARMNPLTDKFPDIVANRVDGLEREIPAEVEWTTEDFRRHGHEVDRLAEADGFLIVWRRTQSFPTPQVEIKKASFHDWLRQNYDHLLSDTVREIDQEVSRSKDPKLWVIWRSGSVSRHLAVAREHGIWGFPDHVNLPRLVNAQAIRKGDTLVFIGPWRGTRVRGPRTGGRVDLKTFKSGELESVTAYTVTKDYFEEDRRIWPHHGDEVWRHRIGFDPQPLLEASRVPSDSAVWGSMMPDVLRRIMIGRSDPIELPSSLIPTLLSAIGRNSR